MDWAPEAVVRRDGEARQGPIYRIREEHLPRAAVARAEGVLRALHGQGNREVCAEQYGGQEGGEGVGGGGAVAHKLRWKGRDMRPTLVDSDRKTTIRPGLS